MFSSLALNNTEELSAVLRTELIKDLDLHKIRFYTHLGILFEFMGQPLDSDVMDKVLCQFVDNLMKIKAHQLAPFYLAHCSKKIGYEKLIQLLVDIHNEGERKEVLIEAMKYDFVAKEICYDIYRRAKDAVKLNTKGRGVSFSKIMAF